MRPVGIIQARMGSSRLPGKILMPVKGRPMLWHIVDRLRQTPGIAEVVVATSEDPKNDQVRQFCQQAGIEVVSGSENDVLDRFYRAAVKHHADPVIRVTGDCPFVDPELVGELIRLFATGQYDHVAVAAGAGAIHSERRFPNGLDAECFSFAALDRAFHEATEPSDREHVTPYLWRVEGRFRVGKLTADRDYPPSLRWTVDYEADYQLVTRVYEALWRPERAFSRNEILDFVDAHPELKEINRQHVGAEGYAKVWNPSSH